MNVNFQFFQDDFVVRYQFDITIYIFKDIFINFIKNIFFLQEVKIISYHFENFKKLQTSWI